MGLKAELILENTWRITGGGCDCYLLDGQHPVMIDCGCCAQDIRAYAEALLHKDVDSVICTHAHIDHTGHCGLFDRVYMTQKTAASSRNWMDEDPATLHLEYDPIFVSDGQRLTIGGRELEILLCDCHAPGNIMILDHTERILFTGDEIDQDQVLLLPGFAEKPQQLHSEPAATVLEYRSLMQRLLDRKGEYDWICSGHNGSPLKPDAVSTMLSLCDEILSGKEGSTDCSSSSYSVQDTHFPCADANYRRFTYAGRSLVYCADSLTDRSKNSLKQPATPLHLMCEINQEKMAAGTITKTVLE